MKTLLTLSLVMVVALCSGSALAFHDGGVAYCAGCHTMHNSQDGVAIDGLVTNSNLLNENDATEACLRCHASYGQFADGNGWGAGGDFYWVTKTFTWESHGTKTSTGDSHGHNVISPGRGLNPEATLARAPGGGSAGFQSAYMACTSCHDPHGNTNFRLLYGETTIAGPGEPDTPRPNYDGGGFNFTEPAPLAAGNSRYTNRTSSRGEPETDSAHTVYKSGMSEWCANCHTNFHDDNATDFVHPVSEEMNGLAANYNAYVATSDFSGVAATSYSGLVPFEDVDVDLTTVDTENYTAGPTSNDQVMCLSCHRAHATPFADATRWDMATDFLVDSHPAVAGEDELGNPIFDGGATQSDIDNMYYGYSFTNDQRSLCNKCHVKDFGDAGNG
ncbi:MAG: hypothetical protein KOO60_12370 [Gemmatimonadales bacterium]|nr:hypothetical protein [Gemmatimonadales bacterium]